MTETRVWTQKNRSWRREYGRERGGGNYGLNCIDRGKLQEFSPDVKHDDLWLDEDEEQRRLVQERRLRVELAMMWPDHEEEGQGDVRNRLDKERIAFAQGTETTRIEVKEGAEGVASRRHYRKALWSTQLRFV